LACALEGCSATRFSEYLSLGQAPAGEPVDAAQDPLPVDDELLASFVVAGPDPPRQDAGGSGPATTARWERLLVDAAVIGGADRWERRLRGLEAELKLQLTELDDNTADYTRVSDELERLRNLQRFALPIIRRLHSLPSAA